MDILSALLVYFLTFWTVLFAILPWGNRVSDNLESGMATSAPQNPRIKEKFLITAFVSALILLIIFLLVEIEIIDFYEISRSMILEDRQ